MPFKAAYGSPCFQNAHRPGDRHAAADGRSVHAGRPHRLPLRNAGQWIIGCALGLYFTPQVVALLAGLWWAIALNIVWALALGLILGEWLYWLHHRTGLVGAAPSGWRAKFHVLDLSRTTTYFAAPIGTASEMRLLLGTSPGGIAEMAITAKVLQLGVPVVTAFHVTRLAAVLLAEPLYRWFYRASRSTYGL